MKTLHNTGQVSSDSYLFLLSCNEKDEWQTIKQLFNKSQLNSLTLDEYIILFIHFTNKEIEKMQSKL